MKKFYQFIPYQKIAYSIFCLNLLSTSAIQAMEEEQKVKTPHSAKKKISLRYEASEEIVENKS